MNKESIEILKVKVDDAGQVDLAIADKKSGFTWAGSSNRVCHEDLPNALALLTPMLAHSNELTHSTKDASPEQKKWIELNNEIVEDAITVTGISWKGSGEKAGIVITGKRTVHHTSVAMNSPYIHLEGENFGFEGDLLKPLAKVLEEVKAYIFDMKGSLFGEEEAEEKEEEKVEA